jgi:error-prone DNA polymerase
MADGAATSIARPPRNYGYVELHAHSDHSLLDGVPTPEALVIRAAELGMPALALTDHNGLYGAVRFVQAAQEVGIKPILGAEMTLQGGDHLTLLVETGEGYANLCRLITLARRDQAKGVARLARGDLAAYADGLIALSGCRQGEIPRLLAAGLSDQAFQAARGYAHLFGRHRFFIEVQRHHLQGEARLNASLLSLAAHAELPLVVTGNAHYLTPEQREVQDILTCIQHRTTLEDAGNLLRSNAEYLLRAPAEMHDLFPRLSEALDNTLRIAERCSDAGELLPAGPQSLPRFPVPGGRAPHTYLRALCLDRLRDLYPVSPPRDLLEKELAIIKHLGLADYFLVVWDIVRFARRAGVRCQGRGSAANSLVAYLLGITSIDPVASDLVFERFLSAERPKTPDIDIDFAADRREEVIQYVYRRYGAGHAAMACTLITFRARSAIRDVARALGFPPALVERLAVALDVRRADTVHESRGLVESFGADLAGAPFQHLLRLVPQLEGAPRHLGIHNGGMVLSGPPLFDLVPLEPAAMPNRAVTQWDKYGLEGTGMVKIDILGLRMLSAIEDAVAIVAAQTGKRPDLDRLKLDDPAVYDMLCRGQTIGVFQVESRAQASLIPQFQPRTLADLVIEISLIRPGPIQANMVHPYLRRRHGLEPVTYLHPLLKPALEETLGVIVFQEQVIKVARDLAGFSPGRAELLRRALGHKRATEQMMRLRHAFFDGAQAKRVPFRIARQVWHQLEAFGGYAFAKSHAAAFAVLTYQSAWLRRNYPAAFFAGLLRHQPMGFYPAHVIISEARRYGVEVRPADVVASELLTTVEGNALRLGLTVVGGLGESNGKAIIEARQDGPFRSLTDFCRRTRLGRKAMEALIWAGLFDGWEVPRRQLLWDLETALQTAQHPAALPLQSEDERPRFGFLSHLERLWAEFSQTGVSASDHLTAMVSHQMHQMGITASQTLPDLTDGRRVWVGGILVSAQRPPTARGVAFLALEDQWGLVNIVLQPEVYDVSRRALRSPFVVVEGELQKRNGAITVVAHKVLPLKILHRV